MNKIAKAIIFLLGLCFLLFSTSSCTSNGKNDQHFDKGSNQPVTFVYPQKTDFTFSCNIQNPAVNRGENFVIYCTLKNESYRDFFIEHGVETISYSYNDISETIDSVAVLEKYQAGKELSRTLNIL